ncbi:MAG TPA: FMN-binding protein [Kineosporiaceae bacterium]|nr:FMN-binding protein [Kineosporiaceae bacterium]
MSTISGLVLLFSYHTSTNQLGETEAASVQSRSAASAPADPPVTSDDTAGDTSSDSSSGTLASGTFTGDSVATRWGPVQVEITVKNGKITKSEAIVYPTENHRDVEINDNALPILSDETIQAQSAQIDFVSGATVTSDGYTQSLQSAIDQAFQ